MNQEDRDVSIKLEAGPSNCASSSETSPADSSAHAFTATVASCSSVATSTKMDGLGSPAMAMATVDLLSSDTTAPTAPASADSAFLTASFPTVPAPAPAIESTAQKTTSKKTQARKPAGTAKPRVGSSKRAPRARKTTKAVSKTNTVGALENTPASPVTTAILSPTVATGTTRSESRDNISNRNGITGDTANEKQASRVDLVQKQTTSTNAALDTPVEDSVVVVAQSASSPPSIPDSSEVFPELPEDANPIDKALFARLAELWDEEASSWTEQMRQEYLAELPRARVTKSTATLPNHNISKLIRTNTLQPNWGLFVVLRSMFGPGVVAKVPWFNDLAARYPLAKEPAYDGIIPWNYEAVLNGTAPLVHKKKVKRSIFQLPPEKKRNRAAMGKLAQQQQQQQQQQIEEDDGEDKDDLQRLKRRSKAASQVKWGVLATGTIPQVTAGVRGQVNQTQPPEVLQSAMTALCGFNPQNTLSALLTKYSDQLEQIRALRVSNEQIKAAIDEYKSQVNKLRTLQCGLGEDLLPGVATSPVPDLVEEDDENNEDEDED